MSVSACRPVAAIASSAPVRRLGIGLAGVAAAVGLGDDHREGVRDDVVQLAGDPGALGRGGQPHLLVALQLEQLGPLLERGQPQQPGPAQVAQRPRGDDGDPDGARRDEEACAGAPARRRSRRPGRRRRGPRPRPGPPGPRRARRRPARRPSPARRRSPAGTCRPRPVPAARRRRPRRRRGRARGGARPAARSAAGRPATAAPAGGPVAPAGSSTVTRQMAAASSRVDGERVLAQPTPPAGPGAVHAGDPRQRARGNRRPRRGSRASDPGLR